MDSISINIAWKTEKEGNHTTSRLMFHNGVPLSRGNDQMPGHCPGAANLRTPTLSIRKCPQCGEEVEVFSTDAAVKCSRCGFVIYNDMESCIQWCRHAKECLGEEVYGKLVRRNV